MKVLWDKNKAEANLRKHQISFEEAESVFDDQLAITLSDELHPYTKMREKRDY